MVGVVMQRGEAGRQGVVVVVENGMLSMLVGFVEDYS
jgi:hypothetical protein